MKTIDCPLQINARIMPDLPVLISGKTMMTYKSLNRKVWLITDYLQEIGIRPSERVAIFAPNSVAYISVLYALWRLGAVPCLMNTRLPEDELNDQLASIDARYLITPLANILTSQKVRIKKINLTQTIEQIRPAQDKNERQMVSFNIDAPASIIFTSGTLGSPKAALHSFGNHFFSAKGSNQHILFDSSHRWLLSLPLYHVGGLSILFRILLGKGGVVLPYAKDELCVTIRKHRVTHLSLVTTQLFRLLQKPEDSAALTKCQAILLGGSAIPESLINISIKYGLPIYTSYGSTEMSSQIATSRLIRQPGGNEKARILAYREIKISPKHEILARGKTLFQGYVMGSQLDQPFDKDGWFATGDIGQLDTEQNLRVTGRKDNMFISGGENIRPEEIERFLCQHESIEQAIVVPVAHNEFGFRPVAFIKERQQFTINKNTIVASLQNRLPKFMTPDIFYSWPTLSNDNSIKISRERLRQLVQDKNPDLKPLY